MRGRIPPEEMFPAGDPRFRTVHLPLPLRQETVMVRAIECGDPLSSSVAFCVHGWACSVYSYRLLMPALAELGIRSVAIDLPGHGLSDKPQDESRYTLDAQAESVIAAMDAMRIPRAALVGHSMGGPICARVAVLAPQRVSALALLAPVGFGTEPEVWALRAVTPRAIAPALPFLTRRWMFELVLNRAYGPRHRPTGRDLDEYWAPTQFRHFVPAMWDILHIFEWGAGIDCGFGEIRAPTAIIDGDDDNLVIRRWVRRYATVVKHASVSVIEGCGHVIPEEAPEFAARAIRGLIG
ncbi:MAG: alpha/beta hydrolase [Gemmatimonadota bacterium]|nr:alpha/beta hydrolase [Gemmatimonadota bacterium]